MVFWKWCGAGLAVLLSGCGFGGYDPVQFEVNGEAIVARGVIDASTLRAFDEITAQYPDNKVLVLQNVPGSADDEANLVLAQKVRARGFNTVVPASGMVASGGTDLFVAGVNRELKAGACVGVHSWATIFYEGRDLDRDDPDHQPYLDFYDVMGIPQSFYWYTLDVASVDDIHWMTATEADQYRMTTRGGGALGADASCEARF
ncbi:alpha/beta hydrolase [Shimia abyssi]|uniref:Uncharacterized protein n=1 Tax=Shimia abyssi TaxID=1662395 RepID=A0A2P8FG40_9RHOB|nr:alpha/beta hydrolase [Shimia abyssi]PSL20677.1 hypothetical protein CLV88_103325 [Shimia abyssi]